MEVFMTEPLPARGSPNEMSLSESIHKKLPYLPKSLLFEIAKYLSIGDLKSLASTSKSWNEAVALKSLPDYYWRAQAEIYQIDPTDPELHNKVITYMNFQDEDFCKSFNDKLLKIVTTKVNGETDNYLLKDDGLNTIHKIDQVIKDKILSHVDKTKEIAFFLIRDEFSFENFDLFKDDPKLLDFALIYKIPIHAAALSIPFSQGNLKLANVLLTKGVFEVILTDAVTMKHKILKETLKELSEECRNNIFNKLINELISVMGNRDLPIKDFLKLIINKCNISYEVAEKAIRVVADGYPPELKELLSLLETIKKESAEDID